MHIRWLAALGAGTIAVLFSGCATAPGTEADRELQTGNVESTKRIICRRDPSMTQRFAEAYGYVIFPEVTKGAAGLGGAFGRGQVYEQGEFIGYASVTQGTVGVSLGGQTYAEVIFFKNERALRAFTGGTFQVAAQASAILVREGASTQADYNDGVMIFTLPFEGAMVDASVGGQQFDYEAK